MVSYKMGNDKITTAFNAIESFVRRFRSFYGKLYKKPNENKTNVNALALVK